ncbi:MAG: glycosyltransferase [Fibromonadaceae bacterium]|jgi:glycosyltransferase involved in cell wall biosynthesis|nr:glycosyltransferase [Fibromonadaceae bacterium]
MPFGTIKQPLPCVGKRNTLSICMIVKNEEANIARAIQSFLPFADEIVVNDTGSSDRTIEIVNSFPKTVLMQSEWIGDFSHSRNLSFEKATCPWILWMDADDYVPPDQVKSFLNLKTTPLDRMISFTVCNTEDGKPTGLRFMQARMFPNHPKMRFEGRIHESVINAAANLGLNVVNTNILIWHMGYETIEIRQKKAKRNLEIQLADPEQEKRIEGLLELGDSYSVLKDLDKAIEYYRRASEFPCPSEQLPLKNGSMNKLGRHLALQNKYEEAKEVFEKCIKQFPKNEEAYFCMATVLMTQQKIKESMPYFRKVLTLKPEVSSNGSNYFIIKLGALKYLSNWEFEEGNFKLSKNYAEEMLKEDKGNQEAKLLLERAHNALHSKNDKRPLLSLCMIVKNEEKNIGECLKSAKDLADEIIVTDTGSIDKTIEIAKSYGARIEHFEWTKDFSAARNYCISKATSRWIIWIDADDRLPERTVKEFRKMLSKETPNKAFYFEVRDNRGTKFLQIRAFPNKEQIKFEGRIHEQILPSIRKLGLTEVKLPLEIIHTGYDDHEVLKQKQLRNLELFKEQFPDEKGMNALDMYHYGTCYSILGEYDNALKWLRESLIAAKVQGYNELLVLLPHDIASILEQQGDLEGALETLELSLNENMHFEPTMLKKAQLLGMLGKNEDAVKLFGYCAVLIPRTSALPANIAQIRVNSLQFLAEYWKKTEHIPIAIEILKILKNMMLEMPYNPLSLAEIYIARDKAVEALDNLEFLKKDLENTPEFAFLYGQALVLTNNIQEAIKVVSTAKETFPQNEDLAKLANAMGI